MNSKLNKWVIAVGIVTTSASAFAASDSANLSVGALVNNVCAIGGGYLDFGNASILVGSGSGTRGANSPLDAAQAVPVICTNGATAQINADFGMFASGDIRRMASGSNRLVYQLYTDTSRTTVLDTTTGAINYTGTGSNQTVTIYGRILASALSAAPKGEYDDTVALTITYTP